MKKTDNYKIHLLRIHLDFFFILKLNYQLNYLCPITNFIRMHNFIQLIILKRKYEFLSIKQRRIKANNRLLKNIYITMKK